MKKVISNNEINDNTMYKVYQLLEFFNLKYNYNNFINDQLYKQGEVWLINNDQKYNVIRISSYSLDETFNDTERINNYINSVINTYKVSVNFLDIHANNDVVTSNEKFDTCCIDVGYYSGVELDCLYDGIKNVLHEVKHPKKEINNIILKINNALKKRFNIKMLNLTRFNINGTKIIIGICSIVFVFYVFLSYKYDPMSSYVVAGADYKMFTLGLNQFWRLISYAFVHSSLIHLVLNMYSLYIIGNYVEFRYGTVKYLIILFSSILVGGLVHGILTDNQIMMGMSGGIYGLFTFYVINIFKNGGYKNPLFISLIAINIFMNFTPGVSWETHLGGAVVGLLFYYLFEKKQRIDYPIIGLIVVLVIVLFVKYVSIKSITPLYLGTDNEVINIIKNLGFDNISNNLSIKLYNYYIHH